MQKESFESMIKEIYPNVTNVAKAAREYMAPDEYLDITIGKTGYTTIHSEDMEFHKFSDGDKGIFSMRWRSEL